MQRTSWLGSCYQFDKSTRIVRAVETTTKLLLNYRLTKRRNYLQLKANGTRLVISDGINDASLYESS